MEAAGSSKTLNFYQTTWRHIQYNSTLDIYCHGNLLSFSLLFSAADTRPPTGHLPELICINLC